ncbi:hypothetical protein CPT_Pookie20 [Bacillus phage Pookie]|uniref:Large polyvalent protein associated domain-containing protein n=1 Tax=Bacillus phage Pookie TaxID=1540093 RepID=A0A0A0RNL9_9CAUD|nr:hypothetical protein CPT_Pookie20 [Bacillus phage Pookie]AIW03705.1 hypothetical protein CPT_Pookie20 [Bacillus phage Pookie]
MAYKPYKYDENAGQKRFDEMFGKGAYNAGMNQAKKVGYWKAQPEIEKMKWKQRQDAFKEAERQRKEAEREAEREYKARVAAEKKANAEKYRMQEKAKKQGRGGVMPSRKQVQEEAKTQAYYKKHGKFPKKIQDELDSMPTLSKAHIDAVHKGKKSKGGKGKGKKSKKKKGFLEKAGSFLSDVGHDVGNSIKNEFKAEKKKAVSGAKDFKYAYQALNPFDKVSAKEANAKSKKNHQKLAKSKAVKEQDRTTMRIADSATLGLLSNAQKRVTGKEAAYKSKRKVGKGGATDFIADSLGMLAPGGASYKGAKAIGKVAEAGKLGKAAMKGTKFAKNSGKFNKEVLRGMTAGALYSGGEVGIREGLNGKDYNWKENTRDAALNMLVGGVADGGGHLLGRGLKSLMKGNKASQVQGARNVLNDDPFNLQRFNGTKRESVKGTFDGQNIVDRNAPRLPAPQEEAMRRLSGATKNPMDDEVRGLNSPIVRDNAARFRKSVDIQGTPQLNEPLGQGKSSEYWKQQLDDLQSGTPSDDTLKEFNDMVNKQVDYLKSSLANRGGVEVGTTDNGMVGNHREVTGRYTVSKNPGWYQDFFKQNGRAPNQSELKDIAAKQVMDGFKDEFGDVPQWQPKALDDLDQQRADVEEALGGSEGRFREADGVDEVLRAIDEQKNKIYADYEKILSGNFTGTPSQKQAIQNLMQQNPDFKGMTLDQLQQLANPLEDSLDVKPLQFKKSVQNRGTKIVKGPDGRPIVVPKYEKDDFLAYTGNMNPNQRAAQRVEGNFTTSPTNDGLKIKQDQPLPFMKQEPALNFKKTIQQEIPRKDLTEVQTQDLAPDGSPAAGGYDYKNPQFKTRMFTQFFNDNADGLATETGKHINRDSQGFLSKQKEKILDATKGFRTNFIDDLAPLEALEKKINGGVASAEDSLYKTARLFRGSPQRAHQVVSQQLAPIIKEMKEHNIKLNDLVDYATAVHARDLNRQGIKSGLSDAEINKDIINFESPNMERLRQKLVAASNDVTKKELVDTGVLSQEAFDAMRAKHPNYMPMFRHFDDEKVGFHNGINSAVANATNPIKKMKGSDRDIIDPMESMVKNMFNAVTQGDKQRVASQLGKLATKDKEGAFVRRLEPGEEKSRLNTIKMFEGGKEVHYEVEPDVYKAMKGLDRDATNAVVKIFEKPASWLRAGATLTPEFSMRNFMRDVPAAFIVSESGFNPLVDFPVGLWQSMSLKVGGKTLKNPGKLYEQFIEQNGGYGNIVSNDRELHQEVIKKVMKEGDTPKFRNIVNPKAYLDVLRGIADVSESAVKVGEYRAALRKGVSKEEAAYRARDIMDFARSGNGIREWNKAVAFLNANIQGKDKLLRAGLKSPKDFARVATKAAVAVSIPTIGIIAAQHKLSNPEQRKAIDDAPQWLKNSFWLMPIPGTNQVARIPKPFDVAPFFADPIERAADFAYKNNPKAFDGYIKQTFSDLSIPVLMSGLVPVLEGFSGHSFFRQGPIDSRGDDYTEFPDHYDIKTSSTARVLGAGINKMTGGEGLFKNFGSPRVVDNTIRGLTGGLGTYAVDGLDAAVVNPILKATGNHDGVTKPAKQISQQPIARAFLMDQSTSGESMNKLYDLREKLQRQRGSKNPSFDERKYDQVKAGTQAVGDVTKEIRSVQNSTTLTAKQKRDRLEQLNRQRNEVARQAWKSIGN